MMKDAVKMLQECGEKGEFYDAKGNKVVLEEKDKLKGHSPSVKVMDAKKIELAKKAEEMGLVVIQNASSSGYDIDKAVSHLNENYIRNSYGKGRCALYVRQAIEAGGITLTRPSTGYAADYGSSLIKAGFKSIAGDSFNILTDVLKGDISVIQPYPNQNPAAGHMTMYNGSSWISDFMQNDVVLQASPV